LKNGGTKSRINTNYKTSLANTAGVKRWNKVAEHSNELKKLTAIASDLELPSILRTKAIELLGNAGTQEALHALLELAANEGLIAEERELALKYAREVIMSGH